jgi:hypothetical protein
LSTAPMKLERIPCPRTAEARRGPPEERRERGDDPRGEEGDAEENQHRPDSHEEENRRRSETAPEEGVDDGGEADGREQQRPRNTEPREPRFRQTSPFANRGDRRNPGRANRGAQTRAERDEHAHEEGDDDGARLEQQAGVRQREADRVEEPEERLGEPEAQEEPDDRGEHADDHGLDDDRPQHLPARCSHRPQRRQLARPLRDRDREGVRDHEGAYEEGDAAE